MSLPPPRSCSPLGLATPVPSPHEGPGWWGRHAARACGAALVGVVLLLYAPTLGHEFVSFDDPAYVTANVEVLGGLNLDSLRWAFTNTTVESWQPVTWLSHMLDVELHGERAGRHHLTSVLLHALNALLVFVVLRRLTDSTGRAAIVAGLFALHPLQAESVAWVSARQDVLAGTFALLAVAAHVSFAKTGRPAAAVWTLVAFALGLATKPGIVALPLALLLLDVGPLGRSREGLVALVREKAFLFALAACATAIVLAVVAVGEPSRDLAHLSLVQRVENALVSLPRYLIKIFWPTDLAILYPHPQAGGATPWSAWQVAGAAGFVGAVTWAAVALRERAPYVGLGWAWFVVLLLPAIGLVQIGPQAMADRYVYLPAIGVMTAVVWGAADLATRSEGGRIAAIAAACAALVSLTSATAHHLRHFENSEALWQRNAAVHPESWIAHNELANLRYAEGRVAEAIAAYRRALALGPDEPSLYNDLAWVLATAPDAALRDGREALALAQRASRATSYRDPGYLDTLAAAYAAVGRFDAAVTWAQRGATIADERGEDVLAEVIRSHAAHFASGQALAPADG